jgi:ankyrin repeat protein
MTMDTRLEGEQLHFLAQSGDIEGIRRLVALGHPVDDFDELGKTPLHYAAECEHVEVAACLIRAGADVNARDERVIGNTPLGEVAATCSLKMAKLLIDAGADPTIRGWMQLTALDKARKRRRGDGPAVFELLQAAAKGGRSTA